MARRRLLLVLVALLLVYESAAISLAKKRRQRESASRFAQVLASDSVSVSERNENAHVTSERNENAHVTNVGEVMADAQDLNSLLTQAAAEEQQQHQSTVAGQRTASASSASATNAELLAVSSSATNTATNTATQGQAQRFGGDPNWGVMFPDDKMHGMDNKKIQWFVPLMPEARNAEGKNFDLPHSEVAENDPFVLGANPFTDYRYSAIGYQQAIAANKNPFFSYYRNSYFGPKKRKIKADGYGNGGNGWGVDDKGKPIWVNHWLGAGGGQGGGGMSGAYTVLPDGGMPDMDMGAKPKPEVFPKDLSPEDIGPEPEVYKFKKGIKKEKKEFPKTPMYANKMYGIVI